MDVSHLPLKCPNGEEQAMKQYFKDFYSIVFMAIVDAEYRFIWASVGAPGNIHDSTLLQPTDLWKRILGGEMSTNVFQQVEDVESSWLSSGLASSPLVSGAFFPGSIACWGWQLSLKLMIGY